MKILKVDHIGVAVEGIDGSGDFWQEVLGLPIEGRETVESQQVTTGFLPAGESEIELLEILRGFRYPEGPPVYPGINIGLEKGDLDGRVHTVLEGDIDDRILHPRRIASDAPQFDIHGPADIRDNDLFRELRVGVQFHGMYLQGIGVRENGEFENEGVVLSRPRFVKC